MGFNGAHPETAPGLADGLPRLHGMEARVGERRCCVCTGFPIATFLRPCLPHRREQGQSCCSASPTGGAAAPSYRLKLGSF